MTKRMSYVKWKKKHKERLKLLFKYFKEDTKSKMSLENFSKYMYKNEYYLETFFIRKE